MAPGVDPLQFLIISSPTQKKVAWTTLQNFASSDGRAFPLVSSGLNEPKGLAIDHANGWLYVADSGANKIFRYTILTDMSAGKPTLVTSGVRVTVSEGHPVEWLTLDKDGNMFYTAPDTNNINKISAVTLAKMGDRGTRATDLVIVSERTLEDQSMLKGTIPQEERNALQQGVMLADKPPEAPNIYSFYEASINPHVSLPTSIWADGADLYWTNGQAGKTAGTIVKGEANPRSHVGFHGSAPFPTTAITNISDGAFGLAKTNQFMFFSQNGPAPRTGLVTGLIMGTNIKIDVTSRLVRPRGLAWDQDQTVYVADEDEGTVWSFPAGRLTANMPLTKTVHLDGAYGMAIFSSKDQAFSANQRDVNRQTFNEESQLKAATNGDESSKTMMNQLKEAIFGR